jgi:hypothetical protein
MSKRVLRVGIAGQGLRRKNETRGIPVHRDAARLSV